jgi:hypothetical protein
MARDAVVPTAPTPGGLADSCCSALPLVARWAAEEAAVSRAPGGGRGG